MLASCETGVPFVVKHPDAPAAKPFLKVVAGTLCSVLQARSCECVQGWIAVAGGWLHPDPCHGGNSGPLTALTVRVGVCGRVWACLQALWLPWREAKHVTTKSKRRPAHVGAQPAYTPLNMYTCSNVR